MILVGAALFFCGLAVLRTAGTPAVWARRAGAVLVVAGLLVSAVAAVLLAVESM